MCGLHATTGLYCPGCGATRAAHELLHGRLLAALQDNALLVLLLPMAAYAAASECRRRAIGRPLWGDPVHKPRLLIALGVLAFAFFALRNLPCFPFVLLTPGTPGG